MINLVPAISHYATKHPRQDSNELANSQGKVVSHPFGGNAGGNFPSDLAELMRLWANMPTNAREACLAIARGTLSQRV